MGKLDKTYRRIKAPLKPVLSTFGVSILLFISSFLTELFADKIQDQLSSYRLIVWVVFAVALIITTFIAVLETTTVTSKAPQLKDRVTQAFANALDQSSFNPSRETENPGVKSTN